MIKEKKNSSSVEKFFYRKILKPLIFTSRLGRKALFGKAGKGLFLEYIYQNRPSGYNRIGYFVDKFLLNLPAARATKYKKEKLINIVQSEITKNTLNNKLTKIVDLGSGSAQYLIKLSQGKIKDQLQSLCIDIDKESLRYGRLMAKGCPVEYRLGNIKRLSHYKKLAHKIDWYPNVIIVSTCYDFLDDGIVRGSIEEIYKMLDSGGILIIVSQSDNPNRKLFDHLAMARDGKSWQINYRKPNILKKWIIESGFKDIAVETDKWGMYSYYIVRKTGIVINKENSKSIFSKCHSYIRVAKSRASNAYYYMRGYDSRGRNGNTVVRDNKVIMFASNDYFGLTTRPEVIESSVRAIKQYGASTASSRLVRGNLLLHDELEAELSGFLNVEDAIVFSTGYMANLGTISVLIDKGEIILIDRNAHASIIDGAKLSNGEARLFIHNNINDLEKLLRHYESVNGKLIVCDGVYSMDGDLAPLPEICKLAEKYNAGLAVDDGHATGIMGENGRGTIEYFKVEGKVDIVLGSLGKTLGSVGGFAAGNHSIIEYVRHNARSFIFSTSLSPVHTAMTLTSLKIIKNEPELRQRLWTNTYMIKEGIRGMGYNIGATLSPIIPIIIGNEEKTFKMANRLEELGVVVDPIIYPAVKKDMCRIRIRATAVHKPADIEKALLIFKKVGKEFGAI
ncbi:MAG: aminotransferase class I/II-fold pyridoxal phosphate-dependent enzyme [Candidatus Omnitrophica bacterium]|nr:aminotransferase class I/II-fold pyridoxal phosphate-dependent enzyme [Candidatus Omnitrophota bacterium]